eukprot:4913233-Pleurochrysis_carterae.AAC.1
MRGGGQKHGSVGRAKWAQGKMKLPKARRRTRSDECTHVVSATYTTGAGVSKEGGSVRGASGQEKKEQNCVIARWLSSNTNEDEPRCQFCTGRIGSTKRCVSYLKSLRSVPKVMFALQRARYLPCYSSIPSPCPAPLRASSPSWTSSLDRPFSLAAASPAFRSLAVQGHEVKRHADDRLALPVENHLGTKHGQLDTSHCELLRRPINTL